MQKPISQKTVVFNNTRLFTILAVFSLTLVGSISQFLTCTFGSSPDTEALSADDLTAGKVKDANTFFGFVKRWLNVPGVNLIVRLTTGKSRTNFIQYFEGLQQQGFTGIALIRAFWNYLDYIVTEHREAMNSAVVNTYVKNVVPADMPNDVAMLPVKGNTPLTNIEALAVETLLLMKYGNSRTIITFEVPNLIGLTPFFGDSVAASEFTRQMYNQYADVEGQHGDGKWYMVGHVLYTEGTNIPQEDRSEVLNGTIKSTLGRITFGTTAKQPAGSVLV